MRQVLSRSTARSLLAGALPLAACALQGLCWPLIRPFAWFLFYPVVFLSAWVGGFGAGLAATTLATALVWWFYMPPVHILLKPGPGPYLNAAMFLAMGCLFAFFHRWARQVTRRAAKAELSKRDDLLDRTSRLAHVGGWEFDVATLKGSWSEETARIHDLPPSTPIDVRSGLNYFHEEDRPLIAEAVRRAMEAAEPYDLEVRLVSAQGALKWVHTTGRPQVQGGRVVKVHGALQDITERKRMELELRESEERFRSIFEQAGVGVVEVDTSTGRFLRVNGKFAELLGYTEQELLGMAFQDVTHPDDRERDRVEVARMAAGQRPDYAVEKRYLHRDGSTVWALLTVRPLRLSGDRVPHGVSVVADITDRKRAEAEIQLLTASLEQRVAERTAELQALNEELESFNHAVSHDLRAPLRAMAGFSHLLREEFGEALPANGGKYLDRIEQASQRMGGLIDGLLQLSRATRSDLVRVPVDLSAMAEILLADLARAEPQRRVETRVEPGMRLQGDPSMLEDALANLLGNAWKYTGRTPDARIEVGTVQDQDRRWIRVADNGCGFNMAYAHKLFHPFQRLHRQEEFPGLGIGLATVRRIVQRHGGEIKAHSAHVPGAAFLLTLPDPVEPRPGV